MTAFVILHYRAVEMTRTCVERIQALDGSKHIVIVDNASPNGTGRILKEEYAGQEPEPLRMAIRKPRARREAA